MEIKKIGIRSFCQYQLPSAIYQRNYAWGETQIEQLIIDELLKDSDKLLYKYANQIEEEEREYIEHRVEFLNKYSMELGINSLKLDSYQEEFILITSETSLAHHNDNARYKILAVSDLVDYIKKKIKLR